MDIWNELYLAARKVQNERTISPFIDAGGVAAAVLTKQGNVYSYACPISDTRQLQVELCSENGVWTVLRWQAVSTVNWQADESMDLWDGNS